MTPILPSTPRRTSNIPQTQSPNSTQDTPENQPQGNNGRKNQNGGPHGTRGLVPHSHTSSNHHQAPTTSQRPPLVVLQQRLVRNPPPIKIQQQLFPCHLCGNRLPTSNEGNVQVWAAAQPQVRMGDLIPEIKPPQGLQGVAEGKASLLRVQVSGK
jgi:hypothetical protein